MLAGVDREFDARYRNPVTLLLLGNQFGLGNDGNVMLGFDAQWRVARSVLLEAQVGIDDLQYEDSPGEDSHSTAGPSRLPPPDRWLGGSPGARSTLRPRVSRSDRWCRSRTSPTPTWDWDAISWTMDQLTLSVSPPVGTTWLLTPELTVLRQGEGELTDPIPAPRDRLLPQLFIGTVEKTWRAARGDQRQAGTARFRPTPGFITW